MIKEIRLNAFDMNCVGHIQHGMWTHPRDRSTEYNTIQYWQDLARLAERSKSVPILHERGVYKRDYLPAPCARSCSPGRGCCPRAIPPPGTGDPPPTVNECGASRSRTASWLPSMPTCASRC